MVQGACVGGALAIASCCDIMLASRDAFFSIPEVRLGFAPLPLIGFFARAMGYRAVRRYLLSGERFSADEALRIGLAQELCDADAIERVLDALVDQCLLSAPGAVARAKLALRSRRRRPCRRMSCASFRRSSNSAAASEEATEGRSAFKEKRKPHWYPPRQNL